MQDHLSQNHFFKFIFLISTVFKVFIEFVTILFLFYVLVFWLQGMCDLGSLTKDRTCTLCIGRWSLNHWTAREVPITTVSENGGCHLFWRLELLVVALPMMVAERDCFDDLSLSSEKLVSVTGELGAPHWVDVLFRPMWVSEPLSAPFAGKGSAGPRSSQEKGWDEGC